MCCISQDSSGVKKKRKSGPHNRYTEELRMEIGKYADENSTALALKKYCPEIAGLTESTVRTFRKRFRQFIDGETPGVSVSPDVFGYGHNILP